MIQTSALVVTGLAFVVWNGVQSGGSPAVRAAGSPTPATLAPAEPVVVPSLVVELPKQTIQLPSGELAEFGAHEMWKPLCTTGQSLTVEDLRSMQLVHAELAQHPVQVIDNSAEVGSFNIVFVTSGSVPAGAPAALAAAEVYMESFFADPITITINCSFQPLGPGVLGGTSAAYGYVAYSGMRAQLVSDMDATDTLQTSLPSGTTCPVRYGSGGAVTNEDRVFTTFANWKAVDGTVAGADANMTFSTNFAFDYDPSNGVGGSSFSFQDVVIHETGHAMGFGSGIDFRNKDMEVLDLYRFQQTDGTGDYNPDTLAEFTVRARLMAYNAPNDAHNSDLISAEYRMSDGSPNQASHFREQVPNIGLMDPSIAPGETWYPAFYSTADVAMFDVIGYDN